MLDVFVLPDSGYPDAPLRTFYLFDYPLFHSFLLASRYRHALFTTSRPIPRFLPSYCHLYCFLETLANTADVL